MLLYHLHWRPTLGPRIGHSFTLNQSFTRIPSSRIFARTDVPAQTTQECARRHHPMDDMGVKGEFDITVHSGIHVLLVMCSYSTEMVSKLA